MGVWRFSRRLVHAPRVRLNRQSVAGGWWPVVIALVLAIRIGRAVYARRGRQRGAGPRARRLPPEGEGDMKRRVATMVLAVLLGVGSLGVFPSAAATKYKNCTVLHRQFYRYGVARSAAAAQKQVNTGHYKPRVSRSVYIANSSLDADKDGTACEVSR